MSTMDSGVQLASGRLAIPMDYIHGQWSSYPITHARSGVLYSDDHGAHQLRNEKRIAVMLTTEAGGLLPLRDRFDVAVASKRRHG